jgi:hypothetical protein
MTAIPPSQWTPPPTRNSWGAGRIVALILGIILLLPGLALVLGGGALLLADRGSNRSDGYLFSGQNTFASDGFALTSDRIDLSTGADWFPVSAALGDARLEVTGTGSSEIFVGIAPVADAEAYLDGVQRTVVNDLGVDAPVTAQRQIDGGEPSGPPADQDIWTEQSSGSGTQQLTWTPSAGNWMLVVMNADGSAGVSMQARIGATFPALGGLAWGLLIGGIALTLIGVLLVVLAARGGGKRPTVAPAGPPVASAGPPIGPPAVPAPRAPSQPPSNVPTSGD